MDQEQGSNNIVIKKQIILFKQCNTISYYNTEEIKYNQLDWYQPTNEIKIKL